MMRTLALLVRRPDLTRYAFRNHYEDTHVKLAEPLLDEATHYVRNHVQSVVVGTSVAFDVLSEFGYPSAVELGRLTQRLASAEGAAIQQDELRFMDKPRNRFFELIPRAAGRADRPAGRGRSKFALLAVRHEAVAREALLAELDPVLDRVAAEGATVHAFETGPLGGPVPVDVVAFVWPGDRSAGWTKLALQGGALTIVRVDERVTRRAPEWDEG